MSLRSTLALLLIVAGCASGQQLEERPDFGAHFEAHGVEGSILVYEAQRDQWLGYNRARLERAFLPASTFKIFNSLVALETGVVADADEVFAWDGVDRGWDRWNQDHTLRSAMQYSAVWAYQDIARRIGAERMQQYIDAVGYGNGDISGGIDQFWLEGGLRVTARQQIELLRRLRRGTLPFSARTMEIVREIMVLEETDAYTIRGKTGWATAPTPQVGWFVGYLERDNAVVYFATSLAIRRDEDIAARQAITRAVLADLGYLPPTPDAP